MNCTYPMFKYACLSTEFSIIKLPGFKVTMKTQLVKPLSVCVVFIYKYLSKSKFEEPIQYLLMYIRFFKLLLLLILTLSPIDHNTHHTCLRVVQKHSIFI